MPCSSLPDMQWLLVEFLSYWKITPHQTHTHTHTHTHRCAGCPSPAISLGLQWCWTGTCRSWPPPALCAMDLFPVFRQRHLRDTPSPGGLSGHPFWTDWGPPLSTSAVEELIDVGCRLQVGPVKVARAPGTDSVTLARSITLCLCYVAPLCWWRAAGDRPK